MVVTFGVLGPLEAAVDGVAIHPGGAKQRTVLAMLLLHANHVVSTDRLIDAVWGERLPPRAGSTLQVYISTLRALLEPDRRAAPDQRMIATRAPGYVLRASTDALDLLRFTHLAERGRRLLEETSYTRAADELRGALALWRGPVLADLVDLPFHDTETRGFEEQRVATLEARIDADLALGRHARVVAELEQLVAEHPLRERFYGQLMLALARSGRQAEALAAYARARETLVTELGIEPSPQLQEFHGAVLAQDALVRARDLSQPTLLFHDAFGLQHTIVLHPAQSPIRIGRLPDNDVTLSWDREVSRHHAHLEWDGGRWWLRDRSRNGSFVNGVRITAPESLGDGDVVLAGKTAVTFRDPSDRAGRSDIEYAGVTSVPQPFQRAVQLSSIERKVLHAIADVVASGRVGDNATLEESLRREVGESQEAIERALSSVCRQFAVDGLPIPERLSRLVERAKMVGLVRLPR